jgi:hypothetical protein
MYCFPNPERQHVMISEFTRMYYFPSFEASVFSYIQAFPDGDTSFLQNRKFNIFPSRSIHSQSIEQNSMDANGFPGVLTADYKLSKQNETS